jgi:hypothetical protein
MEKNVKREIDFVGKSTHECDLSYACSIMFYSLFIGCLLHNMHVIIIHPHLLYYHA